KTAVWLEAAGQLDRGVDCLGLERERHLFGQPPRCGREDLARLLPGGLRHLDPMKGVDEARFLLGRRRDLVCRRFAQERDVAALHVRTELSGKVVVALRPATRVDDSD